MGLFSRNRRREHRSLVSTIQGLRGFGWQSDGTGVQSNGWCGGDIQIGESYWQPDEHGASEGPDIGGDQRGTVYAVRFLRADMPWVLIDVSFCAVEYDHAPGEFAVQRSVAWVVLGASGGNETWSDETRSDVTEGVLYSVEEAERLAYAYAVHTEAADPSPFAGWDGQPW